MADRARKSAEDKAAELAELESMAIAAYRDAHAEPAFDLTTEPWLPVLVDGRPETLGLAELLSRAHEVEDLAETDHFVRAGLRRFLEVLTLELVAASSVGDDAWEDRLADGSGFSRQEIKALLDAEREHLWLWHPSTPFLQRLDLLTSLKGVAGRDRPTAELVPHVPNDSSQAWFLKGGELASDGLAPAAAARYLVARWFYALGGNADRVTTDAEGTLNGAHPGSAFGEGAARVSHAWRLGPSLFWTLLGNLLAADVRAVRTEGGRPAWTGTRQSNATLFLRSAPGMATLLGRERRGLVPHMLRAPLPLPKDHVKGWVDRAREEDPHRVLVETPKGPSVVRMSAVESRLQSLHRVYRDLTVDGARFRRVLAKADVWLVRPSERERAELFLVEKGGTGSSPTVAHTALLVLDTAVLDPDSPQYSRVSRAVGEALGFVDKDRGVRGRLERSLRGAFGEVVVDERGLSLHEPSWDSAAGRTGRALASREVPRWVDLVERLVLDIDAQAIRDDVDEALYRFARDVYDDATTPYVTSARYAAAVARSRQRYLWPLRKEIHA